ncbi:MAG: hypothetical protein R3290_13720 [Acidimicrobiia bacterium]|nr:hypothetical protein [Acidimicrobiia bacterium]
MRRTRRQLLAVLAVGASAGCLGGGGSGTDGGGSPSPTAEASPTPSPGGGTPTPLDCDPADVARPPVVDDANHPGQGYGTKPQELTAQSVADYLADFETAYAWNRLLVEDADLTSLGVDTLEPWVPEVAGAGFLASSRLEVSFAREPSDDPTTRTYVVSYYVDPGPVYRVETADEPVDPREARDRELVQCGADTK